MQDFIELKNMGEDSKKLKVLLNLKENEIDELNRIIEEQQEKIHILTLE